MNIEPYLIFLILGGLLVACEILILQASVGWLLLLGLSALITSLILWFMPQLVITTALFIFIGCSVLVIAVLYKPMRRWQNKPSAMQANDAYGQEAVVVATITKTEAGKVDWSGTQWDAKIDSDDNSETLDKGAKVIITNAAGITLSVRAA